MSIQLSNCKETLRVNGITMKKLCCSICKLSTTQVFAKMTNGIPDNGVWLLQQTAKVSVSHAEIKSSWFSLQSFSFVRLIFISCVSSEPGCTVNSWQTQCFLPIFNQHVSLENVYRGIPGVCSLMQNGARCQAVTPLHKIKFHSILLCHWKQNMTLKILIGGKCSSWTLLESFGEEMLL